MVRLYLKRERETLNICGYIADNSVCLDSIANIKLICETGYHVSRLSVVRGRTSGLNY